jgi:XRE family aerobic/anaerobic benzoate catabolism transcriptional regulator
MSTTSTTLSDTDERALVMLGQRVRQLRQQHGMTTKGLAEASGVTRKDLDALETGRHDADFETLIAVADGLGVPPAELVGDLCPDE